MSDFHRRFRDFDARIERDHRRFRVMFRVAIAAQIVVVALVIFGAAWLLANPEAIGGFVGRIVASFGVAA